MKILKNKKGQLYIIYKGRRFLLKSDVKEKDLNNKSIIHDLITLVKDMV
jgi:hypothetical protein